MRIASPADSMDPSTARKFGKSGASLAQHKYQIGAGPARPEQLRQANAGEILRLLRLHMPCSRADLVRFSGLSAPTVSSRSEEHTSELQSHLNLVCRLLLEKKKKAPPYT